MIFVTLKSIILLFYHIGVVLCRINSFYGKVSSVNGQLLVSNIINTVRFLEELWDIIGMSGFLGHGVYIPMFGVS